MKKRKTPILYLGETGFPYGFGAIQRQLLIAKGLVMQDCKVTVLSFKGKHNKSKDFPPEGIFEGIDYRYTSGNIYRNDNFFGRTKQKIVGKFRELAYIRELKKKGELNVCLVSTLDMEALLLYWVWLKLLGIPFALDYVEFNSAIASRTGFLDRINDYFFDRFAARLCDGIMPISEYLTEHVKKQTRNKPILKLPVLCDFERFKLEAEKQDETRFVYCGSPSYLLLIRFVLDAFDYLEIGEKKVFLHLILGGNEEDLKRVKEEIAKRRNRTHIRVYPNIEDEEIPKQYAGAAALLIPLRPTLQDTARFPHKLGEYLASAKPVITTLFGEIKNYDFIDEKTALVAEDYDSESFSEKMNFVLEHPQRAEMIGKKGRAMGLKNFNYKNFGAPIKAFLLSLRSEDFSNF